MKKTALFSLFLIAVSFSQSISQTCIVTKDSIIAGNRTSSYRDYIYDVLNRIAQVTFTDSGSLVVTNSDAVYYDGNGNISKVEKYFTVGTPVLERTIQYTYTNGKISRVTDSGSNGVAWSISHDISYSGNDISSIIVDASSVTGSPEGFTGSFIDFVWQNGNVSTVTLIVGTDTVETTFTSDNKNNIYKKTLNTDGAPGIFQTVMTNNILSVETVNPETIMGNSFPAGTALLDNNYTYDSNNNVETFTRNPALFNGDNAETTQYTYDCSVGIRNPDAVAALRFYPNPAQDFISIENGSFQGTVKIFDFAGKEILRQEITQTTSLLDVRTLANGMYYIETNTNGKFFKGKVLVNR